MQATPKQVDFALEMLARAGYSTQLVGSRHHDLFRNAGIHNDFSDAFDDTPVVGWLQSLLKWQVSKIIDRLKAEVEGETDGDS